VVPFSSTFEPATTLAVLLFISKPGEGAEIVVPLEYLTPSDLSFDNVLARNRFQGYAARINPKKNAILKIIHEAFVRTEGTKPFLINA